MKKIYLSLLLAAASTVAANAQDYFLKVLDFEGDEWSILIDSQQYGGPLLYGEGSGVTNEDDAYTWYDEGNTNLKSTINYAYGSWCYWSGGVAVSNYYDEIADGSYTNQLSVNYNKDGNHGHNNSANFATCFGYFDGSAYSTDSRPIISFGDSIARVIDHMYIINTAYFLNAMANGTGFSPAATSDTYVDLIAEGFDANGESTGTTKICLQDGTTSITEWTKFDLSSLGAIVTLKFNYEASADQISDYGFSFPGYVAIDDIAVRMPIAPATFEDITIGDEGHMSVSTEDDDEREEFTSGSYTFATGCMSDYDYWYWFGYANQTETTYKTLADQWRNIVGGGYNGSANYGVAFAAAFNGPCYVTVPGDEGAVVPGFYITNSAYAYTSMLNGDGFAKKFGLGDWFKLTITGYNANEEVTGTKEYYLADLRDAATAYIINDWRYVDLSGFGKVKKISFELTSTDEGAYGMNTPAYFCFDDFGAEGTEELPTKNVNFAATFEDITIDGTESFFADKTQTGVNPWNSVDYTLDTYYSNTWGDYYADYVVSNCTATDGIDYTKPYQSTAGGAKNGKNYAVFYADAYNTVDGAIYLAAPSMVSGFWACNTTYVAYGIKNGDGMSDAFKQDDYFKLTVTGYDINGKEIGTIEQMLIDCTDANEWHYIKDWRWVDLTSLGNNVMYVKFSFDGTKKNDYGLTTPTYVCIDDFGGDAPAKNTPYEVIEQPTAIDNVAAQKAAATVGKYFQNGRLVIVKDGKRFTADGAEIK